MREGSGVTCNTAEGATSAPVGIWKCAEGADFDFARVAGILDRYNFFGARGRRCLRLLRKWFVAIPPIRIVAR